MAFESAKIRNIAVAAHAGAGKTSLVEAILFETKAVNRLGSVLDGTTVTDFEPEEITKKCTISSAIAHCDWNGHRINILDTPGLGNFIQDARAAMSASDGVLLLVSSISGVKGETEKLWDYATEFGLPKLIFVTKMDRDTANFEETLKSIEKGFGKDVLPLQIPIGIGDKFEGIVDVLTKKAYAFAGGKCNEVDFPPEIESQVDDARKKLVEKIAETDDSLLEKYLEGGELKPEELAKGLKAIVMGDLGALVTCGAGLKSMGIKPLLDAITMCMPSPLEIAVKNPLSGKNPKDGSDASRKPEPNAPFSAKVFKTVADPFAGKLSMLRVLSGTIKSDSTVFNSATGAKERIGQLFYMMGKTHSPAGSAGPGEIVVVTKLKDTHTGNTLCDEANPIIYQPVKFAEPIISYAIEPRSKGDEDKVSIALHRALEEDPTLHFSRDEESNEMLISGMGQQHLEVTLERLKRKFGVDVAMKSPKIPYRETIKGKAKAQGKYKKQSGGRGQYGDCWIEVEPLQRGAGFEFVDRVVGGSVPRQYIPAVEKGIIEAMKGGIIAGYPMVDLRVSIFDGSFHPVDSSEMAFKIAGSFAIKKAVPEAKPAILEPIMEVSVTTTDETLGNVIGDLNSKRGRVQGMDQTVGKAKVIAIVPMSEMLTYANQLNSLTSGKGTYTMSFSHYEEVPSHVAQKLIAEAPKRHEEK